jgi:Zn-dependent metalloprotease
MTAGRCTAVPTSFASSLLALAFAAAFAAPVGAAGQAPAGKQAVAERALGLLKSHGQAARMADADAFSVRDVIVEADGTEHVRFARRYAGLPVIGGDVVVHSRGGQFKSASLTQSGTAKLSTKSSISQEDAIVAAGSEFGSGFAGVPFAELVVYARGPAAPKLAWQVRMDGGDGFGNPVEMTYIVDARSARVLDRWSRLETARPSAAGGSSCLALASAKGKGRSLYLGDVSLSTVNCGASVYSMRDAERGNALTANMANATTGTGEVFADKDNVWGRNAATDPVSAASDAHYGVASTWDYFLRVHGREGIDGWGTGTLARVHYGRGVVNAFWSDDCYCVTFGDGDGRNWGSMVSLDIAGHELSHGVTSRTAALIYSGESGALNEATSDIFGTMVEFRANNSFDRPDYTIGEESSITRGGRALRYMFKPSRDGASSDCWNSGVANRDVHYGSGVANHFFYLLAEGAVAPASYNYSPSQLVCDGNTSLAGVGRDKAERIWFRALTLYFTSDTDYAGARVATISAARDLYGDATASAVGRAWSAVNVY